MIWEYCQLKRLFVLGNHGISIEKVAINFFGVKIVIIKEVKEDGKDSAKVLDESWDQAVKMLGEDGWELIGDWIFKRPKS